MCHFRPQKRGRIRREFGILLRKCGVFLIRRLQFSLWSDYLEDEPAPTEELQPADEENATFSQQNPKFSSNSTRFLGSKVANSWDRPQVLHSYRDWSFSDEQNDFGKVKKKKRISIEFQEFLVLFGNISLSLFGIRKKFWL